MKKSLIAALVFGSLTAHAAELPGNACQPINAPLTFTASEASLTNTQLIFGSVYGQSAGQVTMTASPAVGSIPFQEKYSEYGTLDLSLTPTGQTASISGRFELSQPAIQFITASMASTGNASAPCVTSIAMTAVQTILQSSFNPDQTGSNYGANCKGSCTGIIDSALVYLTMSTGQVFGPIQF